MFLYFYYEEIRCSIYIRLVLILPDYDHSDICRYRLITAILITLWPNMFVQWKVMIWYNRTISFLKIKEGYDPLLQAPWTFVTFWFIDDVIYVSYYSKIGFKIHPTYFNSKLVKWKEWSLKHTMFESILKFFYQSWYV